MEMLTGSLRNRLLLPCGLILSHPEKPGYLGSLSASHGEW